MENEFLFDIAEKYFEEKNVGNRKWNFMTFWYGEYIPEKQLQSAKKWFAGYNPEREKPIILMSDTCFGLITEGFLLTNTRLYYRFKKSIISSKIIKVLEFQDIQDININCCFLGGWLIINNKREVIVSSFSRALKDEVDILREILQIFVKEIQLRKKRDK